MKTRMTGTLAIAIAGAALAGWTMPGCGGGHKARATRPPADYQYSADQSDGRGLDTTQVDPVRGAPPTTMPATKPVSSATGATLPGGDKDTMHLVLAYPTGVRETSVLLLEKTAPRQVRLGHPYSYELKVTNLTDLMLGEVVVTERLPPSMKSARAGEGAPTTRPADAQAATARPAAAKPDSEALADASGDVAPTSLQKPDPETPGQRYPAFELGPRQSRTITINGTAAQQGIFGTCTAVSYSPSICSSLEVINPSLRLVKTGPGEVLLCEDIVYRYVVSNPGTGTARDVRIEETLPQGLALADGGNRVQLNVGPLAEGRSREFIVKARAANTGKFTTKAIARSGGDQVPSDEVATVVKSGKLTVETPAPDTAFVNKVLVYPITVKNTGDGQARDVVLDVRVDGSSEVLGFIEGGTVPDEPAGKSTLRRPLGTIEPGKAVRVDLAVRARFGGETRMSATARTDCLQPVVANARTNIMTVAGLLLEVVDREDPIRVGDETAYRIEVKNQGSGADQNVQIIATLPDSLAFVKSSGPTPSKVEGKKITFAPLPTLKPGELVRWEVTVKATATDDARFQIDMTSKSLSKPVSENESTRIY